ncbi:MAG: DUF1460 domain-containing protein [Candidatus Sumerlaeaceae bacterium]|nr:DUF1460 domain-containing protein [Candidatus Sumerlaeaceae bacterium]
MRSVKIRALGACLLAVTLIQAAAAAPEPSPRQRAVRLGGKGVTDPEIAIRAWSVKPKAGETTAAMTARVRKDLGKLLASDLSTLNYDSDYWRLLRYLREYPWEKMPARWKQWYLEKQPNLMLTEAQRKTLFEQAQKKRIFEMTPKELDVYLGDTFAAIPDLRARVVHYARKNLGQPYNMYLLGEFPYELYDPQPLFDLSHGDCVVFSEHIYAMALSRNWKEFFANLLRLRYKDGQIGLTTRNHYTEADWNKNNSWLIRDVTSELGATTVSTYREKIDRASFFGKFGIGKEFKVEMLEDTYIPAEAVPGVLAKLEDGDFVNVVRGIGDGVWVGHVGLIGHGPDGTVNFIHSVSPKSVEQPLLEYLETNVRKNRERARKGQAQFLGFKFHRLRAEELQAQIAGTPVPE